MRPCTRLEATQVIAITETPDTGINAPSCVAQYGPASAKCQKKRSKALLKDPPQSFAVKAMGGTVPEVDMNDLLCTTKVCPAVVGNVLVYIDNHHFTQAYGETLAPYLKQRLLATGVMQQVLRKSPQGAS